MSVVGPRWDPLEIQWLPALSASGTKARVIPGERRWYKSCLSSPDLYVRSSVSSPMLPSIHS